MQIVNIGCGMSPTPGALNIDNSFSVTLGRHPVLLALWKGLRLLPGESAAYAEFCREHGVVRMSCDRLKLPDSSVDVVYSSHMLEHLSRARADAFLSEARRVLKAGGVLRLVVPDMRRLADKYIEDGDCDAFVESTLLCNDIDGGFLTRLKLAVTGFRGHRFMYDAASLRKLLARHGFTDMISLLPGETLILYETEIDLAERVGESIYMECHRA